MMHLVADARSSCPFDDSDSRQTTLPVLGLLGKLVRLLTGGMGSRGNGPKRMRIVETLSVGPKMQLVLVNFRGEHFLVGTGPEGVQTIVPTRPERKSSVSRPSATEDEAR